MKSLSPSSNIVRQRRMFCACDKQYLHGCEPEGTWYEPQDIIKGIGLAVKRGYLDGFWVPYKICTSCKWQGCKSQYL